jgi:hypothetical protein
VTIQPKTYTVPALVAAIASYYAHNPGVGARVPG